MMRARCTRLLSMCRCSVRRDGIRRGLPDRSRRTVRCPSRVLHVVDGSGRSYFQAEVVFKNGFEWTLSCHTMDVSIV